MLRWGLRLLALSLPLAAVGFWGLWSVVFEVFRVAFVLCLTAGLMLVLLDFALAQARDRSGP